MGQVRDYLKLLGSDSLGQEHQLILYAYDNVVALYSREFVNLRTHLSRRAIPSCFEGTWVWLGESQ